MNTVTMFEPRRVAPDTDLLPAYVPIPAFGLVPINAFVIHAREPVLVDTGLIPIRDDFMRALRSVVALDQLRWIWMTHADPDHIGSLATLLVEAPNAKVITTFIGMAKIGLQFPLPFERVHLLNPGQSLSVGDRALLAVKPPVFDAPETTGLLDTRTRVLFSSDFFGAILAEPADAAEAIAPAALRDGVITWATLDSPWLPMANESAFGAKLEMIRQLAPTVVLSTHLPPARTLTDVLLKHIASARTAVPFHAPDHAEFTRMLAGTGAMEPDAAARDGSPSMHSTR